MANLRNCSFFLVFLCTFLISNVCFEAIHGKSIEMKGHGGFHKHHHKRSVDPIIPDLPMKQNVDDPQVKKYAQQGVEKLSESLTGPNKPTLEQILEATFFPPAGKLLYQIKIKVKEEKNKDNKKECTVNVWRESDAEPSVTVECDKIERKKRATEEKLTIEGDYIADLPVHLNVNDPEVKKYTQQGLEEYAKKFPKSEAVVVQILEAYYVPLSIYSHNIKVKFGKKACLKVEKGDCENDELETEVCTIYIPNDFEKETIKIECGEDQRKKRAVEESSEESAAVGPLIMDKPLKVSNDEPEVKKYAQKGVDIYAESSTGPNEPILEKIEEALLYPPSGTMLFEIKIKIGTSTCTKGQKENCQLKADGESKPCTVNVFIENDKPRVELKCN